MKRALALYFSSWWLPSALFFSLLIGFTILGMSLKPWLLWAALALLCFSAIAFLGLIAASIWNLCKKRWRIGTINALLVFVCAKAGSVCLAAVMFAAMFGPSEDGFADNLTIPAGLEIAEPANVETSLAANSSNATSTAPADEMQDMIRKALAIPGCDQAEFTPEMPSLRTAATDHADAFRNYLESSPDWRVFVERGNRFAARRWTQDGEPRDSLHGYVSDSFDDVRFQTRCLLCLDRKQWSTYPVQHATEGTTPVQPNMCLGNEQHESRVMIECGDVWVEIFEQSAQPERRVTKATVAALEKEFANFLQGPEAAIAHVRNRSRELALGLAGADGQPFRLVNGMQPGMYGVEYSLNPGEPGIAYLKAFEVTKGTPLSVDRVKANSSTRLVWSANPDERFGTKSAFKIYEGDWGKPYAARFEVWFKPDSGATERKLAERNFKIEGWQR